MSTQITDTLWIGDIEDAKVWEGPLICVTEAKPEGEPERAEHLPILEVKVEKGTIPITLPTCVDIPLKISPSPGETFEPFETILPKGQLVTVDFPSNKIVVFASKVKLNAVSDAIEKIHGSVLVHCIQGIERGPLAVAWYLHSKKGMTMDEAYTLILSKRPIVQRRDLWLETDKPTIVAEK